MKRHYLIYTLWVGMAILSLPSCVREDMLHGGEFSEEENVIPGLETTISLNVNVPAMSVATRSDMETGTDSEINSLWVGIFSATSGECTYAGFVNAGSNGEGGDNLTAEMFHVWKGFEPGSSIKENVKSGVVFNKSNDDILKNGVIIGPAEGGVPGNIYADISDYDEMQISGTPNLICRMFLNCKDTLDNNSATTTVRCTLDVKGTLTVKLSELVPADNYIHLNSIKTQAYGWRGDAEITSIKLIKPAVQLSGEHGNETNFAKLENIKTKTGPSYIVAVGNPINNYGYLHEKDKQLSRTALSSLLPETTAKAVNSGFTWNTYQNLAIRQLDVNDIATPTGNLVMSGVYYGSQSGHGEKHNEDPTAAGWEEENYKPVVIPAPTSQNRTVEMTGAIHLRRLISQVKFHIQAVDYDGSDAYKSEARIVEVIPQGYRVVNVPYTSWLHERQSLDGNKKPIGSANSGDVIQLNNSSIFDYGSGPTALKPNYRSSVSYNGPQYITEHKKTENGQQVTDYYEFDFWMLENKRWALSDLKTYDQREKEYKIDGEKNGERLTLNSGVYTALCSDGIETMNNCASFVEIKCRIIYTEKGLDAINQGVSDDEKIQYRTADAVYTVHLGGIRENWNDFSHRRNHKYTYNVTIVDVDRIIVEANGADESRPGIEGVVTDVTTPPFELDAHYGVFNISLSNLQRTGGIQDGAIRNRFPFRIKVYNGNDEAFYIDQDNYEDYDELYWNWVEFRPTSGPDVLAAYKPYYLKNSDGTDMNERYKDENGNLTTFRLNEIADINTYPGWQRLPNPDDNTEQWYTVFVNEYVYEKSFNEEKNNWVNYVNKSPRMCWLNTYGISSKDEESTYIQSQYVIRQTSIQTFYDIPKGHDIETEPLDAIGIEWVNETFGFNLRWNNAPLEYNNHKIRNNNGRHNVWLYLTDGIDNAKEATSPWETYYDHEHRQKINGINKESFQYDAGLYRDLLEEEPYNVPSIKTYTASGVNARDINAEYTLQILNACMNRNRDNNGNGRIDLEELRWYVPASSEILDIVLGRNALDAPLMDYTNNYSLESPQEDKDLSQKHHGNTRFHYATSNNRVLWAEEGVTINPESDNNSDGWNLPPQQIRCARALGTDLSTDNTGDLSPAFTTNAESSTDGYPTKIYPTYYHSKNKRTMIISGALVPHQETSDLNRLYSNGFEFKKNLIQFVGSGNQVYEDGHWHGVANNGGQWFIRGWHWEKYQWHDPDYFYDTNVTNPLSCWLPLYRMPDEDVFIKQHDDVLQEANRRCQSEYGSGWRLPNMKEAALIKLVLENTGTYKSLRTYNSNASKDRPYEKETINGYEVGSFLTGTYREYGIDGDESRGRKTGYYTSIYYPEDPVEDDIDAENHLLGRIHCVSTGWKQHYYIRCVKDIDSDVD